MDGYTAITAFYPFVKLDVRGCPTAVMLQQVREALRDFFKRTQCWQEDLPAISIVADQDEYDLDAPTEDSEITQITKVTLDDEVLDASVYEMDHLKNRIILTNTPDSASADGLVVKVALQPALTATEIPTRLFSDWHVPIAAGVKSLLQFMPDKSWSNPKLGVYNQSVFEDGVARAGWEVKRKRTGRTLILRPPVFA